MWFPWIYWGFCCAHIQSGDGTYGDIHLPPAQRLSEGMGMILNKLETPNTEEFWEHTSSCYVREGHKALSNFQWCVSSGIFSWVKSEFLKEISQSLLPVSLQRGVWKPLAGCPWNGTKMLVHTKGKPKAVHQCQGVSPWDTLSPRIVPKNKSSWFEALSISSISTAHWDH